MLDRISKQLKDRSKMEVNNTGKLLQEIVKKEIGKFKEEIESVISQEVARGIKQLVDEVKELKLSLQCLGQKDEKVQKQKEQSYSNNERKIINTETYTEKAKKCRSQEIVVTPIVNQTSEQTIEQIKNKIDILSLGVGVDKVINGHKGKVIISCEKTEDRETLTSALKEKIGPNYAINTINKKLPKLKIIGIEENLDFIQEEEEDFLKKIIEQNKLIANEDTFKMKILRKSTNARGVGTIILETDSKTHKTLVELGKIKIGWRICRAYDFVSVLQCYKCWGYNHFARECRNNVVCRICAGNHEQNECTSEHKKCRNCDDIIAKFNIQGVSSDHEVTDRNCKVYKQNIARVVRNTQYIDE